MALTRPTLRQLNTTKVKLNDPLNVINGGSTSANVDVGFVFNRDGGSTANVAVIWDETNDQFALALTSDTGETDANVTISDYADVRVGSAFVDDVLRIPQNASGLRMTNVGAFDNDGSDNFRIFATNDLILAANGDTGTAITVDATNQDVAVSNDLTVAGQATVTGNITGGNLITTGTVEVDRLALTSSQTSVSPLQLTANSLSDGVGALRIDGAQADIFLNPSTATHTTVTFAVNNDQRVAFGMDNNSDFYITRRTGGTWYDDTLVIDRDTGEVNLGYDLTVSGDLDLDDGDSVFVHGDTGYRNKRYVLYGTTTDATTTEIFVGGTSNSRVSVPTNNTIFYTVDIVARRTDTTGESAGWQLKGVADNFSGTTADVGTVYEVAVARDDTNWAVDALADDTEDAIIVTVTGAASKTIKWMAVVKTMEVAN